MRWPFGPPHLTLKPSKKTHNYETKNRKEKRKKNKKNTHTKYQKGVFQLSVNFSFLVATWPKKRAPKKHYKNRGFREQIFEKQFWATKRPFLDKKPNPEIPVIILFVFFLLFQQKIQKFAETPMFIVFWQTKKENFQNLNLKHRKLKNPIFAPLFLKKAIFRQCQIIGHKKHTHNHNWAKKIAWNPYFYSAKMILDQLITLTWTSW